LEHVVHRADDEIDHRLGRVPHAAALALLRVVGGEEVFVEMHKRVVARGEGFTFTRYWWEGEGPREGITPWIQKKLKPGDDPNFGACAKAEVLLSATTPSIYAVLA